MGFIRLNFASARRHTTEVAYKTLVRLQLEYTGTSPIWHPYHETQIGQMEKVQRTAAGGPAGDGETLVASATLSGHPWRPDTAFFYNIHSGTVSLDKDKYLTPAPNLRRTRTSH